MKHPTNRSSAWLWTLALSGVGMLLAVNASAASGVPMQDPLPLLQPNEQSYYRGSFSYAMSVMETDQIYDWRTETSEGQIRVGQEFMSKSKVLCRPFSETYTAHGKKGQFSGYGCERDGENNGWCKLVEGNMLNCAFEPADGFLEQTVDAITDVQTQGKGYQKRATSNFWDWWPF